MIRNLTWFLNVQVASEGRETYHVRIQDFCTRTVLKPFLIALTLMFFFQFSGINIILQYTVDIFHLADSSVEVFQVRQSFDMVSCALRWYYDIFSGNDSRGDSIASLKHHHIVCGDQDAPEVHAHPLLAWDFPSPNSHGRLLLPENARENRVPYERPRREPLQQQ